MRVLALLLLVATPALSESLVAARTIRAQAVITLSDLEMTNASLPGALSDPADAIGQEARVTIHAGRAIRPADLGAPALIERNDVVAIIFRSGGLVIAAEGRALGRGGEGEVLRVMNLASRSIVTGRVGADGALWVGDRP
jgi:flagella basal body P-ring formation protein FlgA